MQIGRGGIALGMSRLGAMGAVGRCAADTMPPMRLSVLLDVAANPDTTTAEAVKRLQLPRKTVDRTLQELQLLGLLTVDSIEQGQYIRWIYRLAEDVSQPALDRLAGNVSRGTLWGFNTALLDDRFR